MKLIKSLVLGSVASAAAVFGADAADLPGRTVAAVEYVRVCSTYGSGFFYIPGTETCLRIGGRVRADALYVEPFDRSQDVFGFRARGRIQADARTETAYGLLRTFIRFEITQSSGSPFDLVGRTGTSPDVAQAFVQFGGLTAGKVTSFFDNPDLPTEHFGTLRFSDAPDVAAFAYTFSFGTGFSATLALEDGLARRVGSGLLGVDPTTGLPIVADVSNYAGQTAPDLVGNVRYAGTWGSAQLSGAVHQNRGLIVNGFEPDTEYGYAVGLQAGINLPFLGAGDAAWLAATYTNGALGYLGVGGTTSAGNAAGFANDVFTFPNASTSEARGWSVAGGVTHNWTPSVRSSLFGSYADVSFSGAVNAPIALGGFGFSDFREYRVGANTIWSPVAGLNLGLEVIYANVDPRGGGLSSDSATEGRIRVQRDF
jgi:Porin subfamily